MRRPTIREAAAGCLLLAGLALQLLEGLASDGFTNDEILYIGDGYRQRELGDYGLNPTHPALGQRFAGWGLVGLDLRLPERREGEDVLAWCYRFVHVENDAARLLRRARLPNVLLTLGLGVALWAWARAAGGVVAGLLALALASFHPSLLAHGHLATTDMPAALAMLLASWAFWCWVRSPGAGRAGLVAVFLGLGAATRLSAWLLVPAFALLAALGAWRSRHGSRTPGTKAFLTLVGACVVVVPLVIWASYGFHSGPRPADQTGAALQPRLGLGGRMVGLARSGHLLPDPYLEGARFQLEHNLTGHPAYLLGRHSKTGWWHYFLVAFLVKNTPGFLLALALAVGLRWKKGEPRPAGGEPAGGDGSAAGASGIAGHWLVPVSVIFVAVSAGHIQIGERYLLPSYPYLILFAAVTLAPLARTRKGGAALLVLLAFHAAPALAVAPRGTLTYFNVLAGGPEGGHRVLLDSNLDWGQDLPRLASWMRERGIGEIQLAYHGVDDPSRYGIGHSDLPGWHLYPAHPPAEPFRGTLAVSPNLLFGLLPRLGDPYAALRARPPDDRAGVFFVYRPQASSSSSLWMSPVTSALSSPTYMSISLRTPKSGR